MGIEEILGKGWEGLGEPLVDVTFTVLEVDVGRIRTEDSEEFNAIFNGRKYFPLEFKPGETYVRQIWKEGEFVSHVKVTRNPKGRIVGYDPVGKTYFFPKDGKPIEVEGDPNDFIERLEEKGKENVYNRLLAEGKIIAGVRIHAATESSTMIEVVMAKEKDFGFQYAGVVENVFEAYSILLNPADGSARIIKASYEYGSFDEHIEDFEAAKPVKLNRAIIEAANKTMLSDQFEPLEKKLVEYIRENAFCPNPR